MSDGCVRFVGCGPGAADLLTLRAVHALQTADVVVWNASLLAREALDEHVRAEAEIVAWPPATASDILAVFDRAAAEGLSVVRIKGGDPTHFGELEPELSAVRERGLACEIVPGVSALAASAAALGREVAAPDAPLLLAHAGALAGARDSACAVALFGIGRDARDVQRALLERGLPETTPCSVAIEVSRRDEAILSCVLGELAETVEDHALGALSLVLVEPSNLRPVDPPGD